MLKMPSKDVLMTKQEQVPRVERNICIGKIVVQHFKHLGQYSYKTQGICVRYVYYVVVITEKGKHCWPDPLASSISPLLGINPFH